MTNNFSLRSFDQILDDIVAAREWYDSLNIQTEGSRLDSIYQLTQDLIGDLGGAAPQTVVDRWSQPDTYYALSDGAAFGLIAREISKAGPNLLPRKKLRIILEGPISPTDENLGDESVNARNIFTELELAARFSEAGIEPKGFDDHQFDFEGIHFSVQCKRLHSKGRVKDNIEHAYSQLQTNLASDQHRGLIGLSIEKVLGLENQILPVANPQTLSSAVHRWIDEFRREHQSVWWSFVDTRVVGILVILRFLCHTLPHNVIGPAYYFGFANLASPELLQATDLERLRRLAAHLQSKGDSSKGSILSHF